MSSSFVPSPSFCSLTAGLSKPLESKPRQRGLGEMASVHMARTAVVIYRFPLDAGFHEVLLWVFWRASQLDLRWQSPQCTQCLSLAAVDELIPGLGFQTPYTDPCCWDPFTLLGNHLEYVLFREDSRSAPSHGIYIFPSRNT